MKKISLILLSLLMFLLMGCGAIANTEDIDTDTQEIVHIGENMYIPSDVDLKVLDVREAFGYHNIYSYYVNVVLEGNQGERYYLQRCCNISIDEKYQSLIKLVPGDYIRYDSETNSLKFCYSNSQDIQ